MQMFNPPHPGTILLEDWIKPLNMSISKFALKLGTSRKNLSEIVDCKTGISPEMALKLAYRWLDDKDAKKDKLYEYWKYIIKRD